MNYSSLVNRKQMSAAHRTVVSCCENCSTGNMYPASIIYLQKTFEVRRKAIFCYQKTGGGSFRANKNDYGNKPQIRCYVSRLCAKRRYSVNENDWLMFEEDDVEVLVPSPIQQYDLCFRWHYRNGEHLNYNNM